MAFLRNLLAVLVGLFIFSIIGFFMFLGFVSALTASTDPVPEIEANSVLHLEISGIIAERSVEDPIKEMLSAQPTPLDLMDLLMAIRKAKTDERIRGIYLEPKFVMTGSGSLQEIRDALLDFKTSGKFVYAYGEYLGEGDYYLASIADSITLQPTGSLEFNGLSANVVFFKGLFDKLDIQPEIFRVGEFKSFIEPFVRKSMSEENRLQLSELIGSVHSTYLNNVSESRGIAVDRLTEISNQMLVRLPEDARQLGLVDHVGYEDEVIASIKQQLGLATDDKFPLTGIRKYMKVARAGGYSKNKIAVIVANGDIIMGESMEAVGGDQFVREIQKARENDAIKAIVLRVNSPGGSLTASDMIWREVMRTKGNKPIIASMADVAASGGYYISMACDTIVAQPNTITGSIGIFGILFNFGDFLENKLGITTDNVKTGEYSDMYNLTRPLTSYERTIIQTQVEAGYDTFIAKAALGRGMSEEAINEIAGGRVWTGVQAQERGLVDLMGSLEDAVKVAAEKAGVSDDYSVRFFPEQKPFLDRLLEDLTTVKWSIFEKDSPFRSYEDQLKSLQRMKGVQARMAGDVQIN